MIFRRNRPLVGRSVAIAVSRLPGQILNRAFTILVSDRICKIAGSVRQGLRNREFLAAFRIELYCFLEVDLR